MAKQQVMSHVRTLISLIPGQDVDSEYIRKRLQSELNVRRTQQQCTMALYNLYEGGELERIERGRYRVPGKPKRDKTFTPPSPDYAPSPTSNGHKAPELSLICIGQDNSLVLRYGGKVYKAVEV